MWLCFYEACNVSSKKCLIGHGCLIGPDYLLWEPVGRMLFIAFGGSRVEIGVPLPREMTTIYCAQPLLGAR
jgi:hypothetical protein